MPEFVEAEAYRRTLDPVLGSRVRRVLIHDERLLRRGDETDFVVGAIEGTTVDAARRVGKVVLIDFGSGHTGAVGFGLRGRFVLDQRTSSPSGRWRDASVRPEHVRLSLEFDAGDASPHGSVLELEDQLRLATLVIDIDETTLGPDVLDLDKRTFTRIIGRSDAAIKSLLMDQGRIAGIGNLIADEILYQGKIDPRRASSSISSDELDSLWLGVTRTRTRLLARGGSHHGVLIQSGARRRGAACPRCDVEIERIDVGGRTTYRCPSHQR